MRRGRINKGECGSMVRGGIIILSQHGGCLFCIVMGIVCTGGNKIVGGKKPRNLGVEIKKKNTRFRICGSTN